MYSTFERGKIEKFRNSSPLKPILFGQPTKDSESSGGGVGAAGENIACVVIRSVDISRSHRPLRSTSPFFCSSFSAISTIIAACASLHNPPPPPSPPPPPLDAHHSLVWFTIIKADPTFRRGGWKNDRNKRERGLQQAEQRPGYTAGRPAVPMRDYERLKTLSSHHHHLSLRFFSLPLVSFPFSLFLRLCFPPFPPTQPLGPEKGPRSVEPTTVIARSSQPANQHSLLHFCSGRDFAGSTRPPTYPSTDLPIHSPSLLSFHPLPSPDRDRRSHREGHLIAIYLWYLSSKRGSDE